jgi:hypothetical protein
MVLKMVILCGFWGVVSAWFSHVGVVVLIAGDARGSESDDAELPDCTLMALDYLGQVDQRKIGKKS